MSSPDGYIVKLVKDSPCARLSANAYCERMRKDISQTKPTSTKKINII